MNDKTTTYSDGASGATLLGVAFIVLKLCKVIDWSWWWVLGPFWIPALLFLVIVAAIILVPLIVAGVYLLIAHIIDIFNKIRK